MGNLFLQFFDVCDLQLGVVKNLFCAPYWLDGGLGSFRIFSAHFLLSSLEKSRRAITKEDWDPSVFGLLANGMRLCWTHPSGHLHKITLSVGRFVSCGGQVGPLGNEEIADMSLGFQSSKDGMEGKIR